MIPLLEIKSIPIEIQVKTKSASLEFTRGTAEMEISRSEQGSVDVKSRPIQVRLDTFEPRDAASASARAASQAPQAPPLGSYEATAAYADQGQLMLNARIGVPATAGAEQQQTASDSAVYQQAAPLAQAESPNMVWEDGAMEIRYEMDKLNFDWKIDQGEFKFTPGDIEFTVAQRPSIKITYNGEPIYVPRSADPNYQPVNVEA